AVRKSYPCQHVGDRDADIQWIKNVFKSTFTQVANQVVRTRVAIAPEKTWLDQIPATPLPLLPPTNQIQRRFSSNYEINRDVHYHQIHPHDQKPDAELAFSEPGRSVHIAQELPEHMRLLDASLIDDEIVAAFYLTPATGPRALIFRRFDKHSGETLQNSRIELPPSWDHAQVGRSIASPKKVGNSWVFSIQVVRASLHQGSTAWMDLPVPLDRDVDYYQISIANH
ncbi:MAG TPA: hypothetical protein VH105_12335, partial [Burkholderiales bacterium]|nr:hypothetical protein [Burkholderiales bacterium]